MSINPFTWRNAGPVPDTEVAGGSKISPSLLSVQVSSPLLRLDSSLHPESDRRGCLEASLVMRPALGKSVRKMRICVAVVGKLLSRLLSLELMNSLISFDRIFPAWSNQISRENVAKISPQQTIKFLWRARSLLEVRTPHG